MLLSEKKICKGYLLYDSNYKTFWKRQNYEDSKKGSCQGLEGKERDKLEGWIGRRFGELWKFFVWWVQFSYSVVSDSLRPHGWQHTRLPCPSPTPRACSDSCPLSQWCHPTIPSSVVLFFSCLQSFPASGSFPMSQFFPSGGQGIGLSASASVLPMNIRDWLHLGWTGWISLLSKGLSRVFSNTTVQKHQFFAAQRFFMVQFSFVQTHRMYNNTKSES